MVVQQVGIAPLQRVAEFAINFGLLTMALEGRDGLWLIEEAEIRSFQRKGVKDVMGTDLVRAFGKAPPVTSDVTYGEAGASLRRSNSRRRRLRPLAFLTDQAAERMATLGKRHRARWSIIASTPPPPIVRDGGAGGADKHDTSSITLQALAAGPATIVITDPASGGSAASISPGAAAPRHCRKIEPKTQALTRDEFERTSW